MERLDAEYDCIKCFMAVQAANPDKTVFRRMICCGTCGNKRCPKATDHRLGCTGSNEPGQSGSAYA